jgi:hypothetical protein
MSRELAPRRPSRPRRVVEFAREVDQIRQDPRAGDEGGPERQCVEKSHSQPPRVGFHRLARHLDTTSAVADPRDALTVNGARRTDQPRVPR